MFIGSIRFKAILQFLIITKIAEVILRGANFHHEKMFDKNGRLDRKFWRSIGSFVVCTRGAILIKKRV